MTDSTSAGQVGPTATDRAAASAARSAARRGKVLGGVPVWRVGKPDAVLADAVGTAREAVLGISKDEHIGAHLGARSEGERVVTHLFECTLPGYAGWQWFAVLARVARSRVATVNEVGLLPSANSLLAPEWLPWAQRVRPEDSVPDVAELLDASSGDAADDDAPAPGDAADDAPAPGDAARQDGPAENDVETGQTDSATPDDGEPDPVSSGQEPAENDD
jgi:Protein of unknown function (DUF3027)